MPLACRGHLKYDVKAEHYTLLTDAVAATLEQVLGPRWDASRKEAWGAFIGLLLTVVSSAYAQGATPLVALVWRYLIGQLLCPVRSYTLCLHRLW